MIPGISCDAGGETILFVGGNNSRNFRTNADSLQSGSFASFERDSASNGLGQGSAVPEFFDQA
jgi:hypothetical protein